MIIFLYGPDSYRLKENLDIIIGAYQKKYENHISYYSLDLSGGSNFDELANAVKSISFFDEPKLIVVKNSFSIGPSFLSLFSDLADNLKLPHDKKTVVVFVENKKQNELQKMNKDLHSFLTDKQNLIRNIEPLNGAQLASWIRSKFKEKGHTASKTVVDLLIDNIGNESWALANEIEKLCNYKPKDAITEKDVNLLTSYQGESSIFDLVDAVGNLNKARAFEMAYRLLNTGHDGYYLLSMLTGHFENLLSVSDMLSRSQASGNGSLASNVVAQKCGLHPFVAKKAMTQSQRFTREELVKKFNHLADLDIKSKNGAVNLEDSLYNFLVS